MRQYIEEGLRVELASGRVSVVEDSDRFFSLLGERYPMGLDRIAWDKVATKRSADVLPQPMQVSSDDLQARLSEHRGRVRRWFAEAGVEPTQPVVWLGDMTDIALQLSSGDLLDLFPVLFSLPQHSYALPPDASWCLNYVMEGELFFAQAPSS